MGMGVGRQQAAGGGRRAGGPQRRTEHRTARDDENDRRQEKQGGGAARAGERKETSKAANGRRKNRGKLHCTVLYKRHLPFVQITNDVQAHQGSWHRSPGLTDMAGTCTFVPNVPAC